MVLERENFLEQARPLPRAGPSAKVANSKDERTLFFSAQDCRRGAAVTGEAELTPADGGGTELGRSARPFGEDYLLMEEQWARVCGIPHTCRAAEPGWGLSGWELVWPPALCLPANPQAQNTVGAQDLSVKQRNDEQTCAKFVRSLPPPTHCPSAPPHSPP